MEYRIRDVLKLPSLKEAVVLSGANYLQKVVKGTTIMEAPDITDWLKGGELILTSLYPIRSFDEKEQTEFVMKLAENEVSALVIKNNRFVHEIPQTIIDVAEKCNLPIIQIPRDVPYVDIMYPVMEGISNSQVKKLQYFKEIHDQFIALSLADESPEKIIETLENLIQNPVALFDRNFLCITTTQSFIATFEVVEKMYYDNENMKSPYFQQIVNYPELNGKKGYQIVVPIETINHIKVYLLISEMNKPLEKLDFMAIEHAATSLSLELVKQFAVAEVDNHFKNDFLEQLIDGKLTSNIIYQNANLIGWDVEGAFAVVLFKLNKNHKSYSSSEVKPVGNEETLLYETIYKFLPHGIIGNKSDFIVVLWKIKNGDHKKEVWIKKVKEIVTSIKKLIKGQKSKLLVQVGIGTLSDNIEDISESFKRAKDALEFGEILNGTESITAFSELGVFRMLCQYPNPEELKTYIPPSLQRLINYQQTNKTDLLATLKVFLQCNQNATKASQLLYIHHKTAVYRVERIKGISGMNFEDAEEMLLVQIGLKIIELLERKQIHTSEG